MSERAVLWTLLAVQSASGGFFLFDAVFDRVVGEGVEAARVHDSLELFIAVALLAGIGLTVVNIRRLHLRETRLARQVDLAASNFADVIEAHFDDWKLTASERDIALLVLKGLSTADIAGVRRTAEGTVKAQTSSVYRKSGVSGRMQLLSLFVDELFDAPPFARHTDL